jgi:5-methylcytosine-specific restriction enzyme subunit McrC
MHRLYERFVLAYYQRHHPEFLPHAKQIDWDITDGNNLYYLPKMKTDIVMQHGNKKLIIDTKYYSKTMQSSHDKKTFISENLYQIFAYVKNSDKGNTGNVAGILLYAKTDEDVTPDADNTISGNKISLKTLDLNREWKEITAQLDKLCSWLKDGETAHQQ